MNAILDLVRRHYEEILLLIHKQHCVIATINVNVMVNNLLKRMDALWAEGTAAGGRRLSKLF